MEATIERSKVDDHLFLVKSIVAKFIKKQRIEDSDFYSHACIALMNAHSTYDSAKGAFSTWATKIIKRSLIDQYRKQKKEKNLKVLGDESSDLIDNSQMSMPVDILSILLKEDKNESKIEKQNKEILVEHFLNKKTWAEIGRKLKITRERARQKGQSAIENIRKKYRLILDEVEDVYFGE